MEGKCESLLNRKLIVSVILSTGLILEMYRGLSYIKEKMQHKNLSKEQIKNQYESIGFQPSKLIKLRLKKIKRNLLKLIVVGFVKTNLMQIKIIRFGTIAILQVSSEDLLTIPVTSNSKQSYEKHLFQLSFITFMAMILTWFVSLLGSLLMHIRLR